MNQLVFLECHTGFSALLNVCVLDVFNLKTHQIVKVCVFSAETTFFERW